MHALIDTQTPLARLLLIKEEAQSPDELGRRVREDGLWEEARKTCLFDFMLLYVNLYRQAVKANDIPSFWAFGNICQGVGAAERYPLVRALVLHTAAVAFARGGDGGSHRRLGLSARKILNSVSLDDRDSDWHLVSQTLKGLS